jgi:predicted small metal-binding protein
VSHMHEVRIEHDERFLCRPWGIVCACGFRGAAASQEEAERILSNHAERKAET